MSGDALDGRLADGLERLATAVRALAVAGSHRLGLSVVQMQVVLALAHQPVARRAVTGLAAQFGVTTPTMSDAVAALERKGLVERRPVAGDARRRELVLTSAGARLAAQAASWHAPLRQAVDALPEAEQARLLSTILTLIAELHHGGVITVDHSCVTCRFFRPRVRPGSAAPHCCVLLDRPLPPAALRVDCPDHEPDGPAHPLALTDP